MQKSLLRSLDYNYHTVKTLIKKKKNFLKDLMNKVCYPESIFPNESDHFSS